MLIAACRRSPQHQFFFIMDGLEKCNRQESRIEFPLCHIFGDSIGCYGFEKTSFIREPARPRGLPG